MPTEVEVREVFIRDWIRKWAPIAATDPLTSINRLSYNTMKLLATAIAAVEQDPLEEEADGPDLSKAQLFCDGNQGVYVPQVFAQKVARANVTGVSDEDYKVLEAGPEHEHYWEAWADVLDNAKITDPETKQEMYLHQDGDLWIVPVEKEEAVADAEA